MVSTPLSLDSIEFYLEKLNSKLSQNLFIFSKKTEYTELLK